MSLFEFSIIFFLVVLRRSINAVEGGGGRQTPPVGRRGGDDSTTPPLSDDMISFDDEWQHFAVLPNKRTQYGLVTVDVSSYHDDNQDYYGFHNHDVYDGLAFVGGNERWSRSSIDIWDIRYDIWHHIPMRIERRYPSVATMKYGKILYICGGHGGGGDGDTAGSAGSGGGGNVGSSGGGKSPKDLASCEVLDVESFMIQKRMNAQYGGAGANLLLGSSSGGMTTKTQWMIAPMQQARHGCTAVTIDHRYLVVMGGWSSSSQEEAEEGHDDGDDKADAGRRLSTVEMYDVITGRWIYLPSMSQPRSHPSAIVVRFTSNDDDDNNDDQGWGVIVSGGYGEAMSTKTVEMLHGGRWISTPNLSKRRAKFGTVGIVVHEDTNYGEKEEKQQQQQLKKKTRYLMIAAGGFGGGKTVELHDVTHSSSSSSSSPHDVQQLPSLKGIPGPCKLVQVGGDQLLAIGPKRIESLGIHKRGMSNHEFMKLLLDLPSASESKISLIPYLTNIAGRLETLSQLEVFTSMMILIADIFDLITIEERERVILLAFQRSAIHLCITTEHLEHYKLQLQKAQQEDNLLELHGNVRTVLESIAEVATKRRQRRRSSSSSERGRAELTTELLEELQNVIMAGYQSGDRGIVFESAVRAIRIVQSDDDDACNGQPMIHYANEYSNFDSDASAWTTYYNNSQILVGKWRYHRAMACVGILKVLMKDVHDKNMINHVVPWAFLFGVGVFDVLLRDVVLNKLMKEYRPSPLSVLERHHRHQNISNNNNLDEVNPCAPSSECQCKNITAAATVATAETKRQEEETTTRTTTSADDKYKECSYDQNERSDSGTSTNPNVDDNDNDDSGSSQEGKMMKIISISISEFIAGFVTVLAVAVPFLLQRHLSKTKTTSKSSVVQQQENARAFVNLADVIVVEGCSGVAFEPKLFNRDYEHSLFAAVYYGNMDDFKEVFVDDPDIDINTYDSMERTPTDFAAIMGQIDMMDDLVRLGGRCHLANKPTMRALARKRAATNATTKKVGGTSSSSRDSAGAGTRPTDAVAAVDASVAEVASSSAATANTPATPTLRNDEDNDDSGDDDDNNGADVGSGGCGMSDWVLWNLSRDASSSS